MSELTDEVRSFLGERRYAVLATRDPDGGIRLAPIWYLFEDDRFHFATPSGSRKVMNVERNVSASVVVDAREPGRERWVSGPARLRSCATTRRSRSTPVSGGGTSRRKRSTARSRLRYARRMTSRSG